MPGLGSITQSQQIYNHEKPTTKELVVAASAPPLSRIVGCFPRNTIKGEELSNKSQHTVHTSSYTYEKSETNGKFPTAID